MRSPAVLRDCSWPILAACERSVVAGTTGLLDDVGHLLDLPLGTAEGTELGDVSTRFVTTVAVGGSGWCAAGKDVPSSLRGGGRACPWHFGATR